MVNYKARTKTNNRNMTQDETKIKQQRNNDDDDDDDDDNC
jgi:hypothetical protein